MYCQKCGAENPEEAKFCRDCGLKIVVDPPLVVEKIVYKDQVDTHRSKEWLWFILAVVILIGLVVIIISFNKQDNLNSELIDTSSSTDDIEVVKIVTPETPYVPTKLEVKKLFASVSSDLDEEDYSVEKDEVKIDLGDLNNDGLLDAVVDFYFYSNDGGNANLGGGLMVFVNNGETISYSCWMETNNTKLDYINESGLIKAIKMEYAEDDPRCCPSISTSVDYRFQNDELVEF